MLFRSSVKNKKLNSKVVGEEGLNPPSSPNANFQYRVSSRVSNLIFLRMNINIHKYKNIQEQSSFIHKNDSCAHFRPLVQIKCKPNVEKPIRDLVNSNQIQIVITLFRLVQHQTEFRLAPNGIKWPYAGSKFSTSSMIRGTV